MLFRIANLGSPPRAWGQSISGRRPSSGRRFTPTGVGTMSRHSAYPLLALVHPHGRGDNSPSLASAASASGSPPRAWGQSVLAFVRLPMTRFTPTGVGTILIFLLSLSGNSVHPHGRGDNLPFQPVPDVARGSPPRAWGQLWCRCSLGSAMRFTPTGVGTISERARWRGYVAVHPHGRGDNRSP